MPQWKQLESRFFEFVKQCGLEVDQKQSSKKIKDSAEINAAKLADSAGKQVYLKIVKIYKFITCTL